MSCTPRRGEGGPLNEVEWWVRCYSEFPQNSVIALFEKLLIFCDEILSLRYASFQNDGGGRGANADGERCGIAIFTREINRQNLLYSPTNGEVV